MADAWLERAACVGKDPRMWDIDHPALWPKGQAVCSHCPVQIDCYQSARGDRQAFGMYGGIVLAYGTPYSPDYRRQVRSERYPTDPSPERFPSGLAAERYPIDRDRGGDSGCADPGPASTQLSLY